MVEKSGQMGLQMRRDASGEPSSSTRRTSFSNDEERQPAIGRSDSIASDYSRKKSGTVVEESIPEVETPTTAKEEKINSQPKEVPKVDTPEIEAKKTVEITNGVEKTKTNGNSNGPSKSKTVIEKAPAGKITSRPTPISTAKVATAPKKSPMKSPIAPKTPTTPRGRGRAVEQSNKISENKPEKKTSRSSLAPAHASKTGSRPSSAVASHTSAPKTRILASPPQTGFVKPKPRSPTRPVKLPASLMAHTASSGSKTATAVPALRRSLSRANGNSPSTNSLQAHSGAVRSPSRNSNASTSKTSTVTRRPSTLNKTSTSGRPSLGPPPASLKKQTSRQSLSKSVPADDSFLNRMMRPTTSSASKTAAASPVTPPKRASSVMRSTTKEANHKTHEAPKAPLVPKPVVKAAAVVAKPIAKPVAKVANSVAKHVKKEPEGKAKTEPVREAVKVEEKQPQGTTEAQQESTQAEESTKAEEPIVTEESELVEPTNTVESVVEDDSAEVPNAESSEVEESNPGEVVAPVTESVGDNTLNSSSPVSEEPEMTEEAENGPEPIHQILSPVIESPAQVRNPEITESSPSLKVSKPTTPEITTPEAIVEEDSEASNLPEISSLEKIESAKIPDAEVEDVKSAEDGQAAEIEESEELEEPEEIEEAEVEKADSTDEIDVVEIENPEEPKVEEAEPITDISQVESAKQHEVAKAEPEAPGPTHVKEDETKTAEPEKVEDPEDVRAREEIARLNAELLKDVSETY